MASLCCRLAARELNREDAQEELFGTLLGSDGENYEEIAA
jgi:hypothetical protein